jgi:hypothetical protein
MRTPGNYTALGVRRRGAEWPFGYNPGELLPSIEERLASN